MGFVHGNLIQLKTPGGNEKTLSFEFTARNNHSKEKENSNGMNYPDPRVEVSKT